MDTVTVESTVTALKWAGATAPGFMVESGGPFITGDGIPVNNGGSGFRERWDTTINGSGYLVVPDVELPPTENSSDPSVLYYAYFVTASGERIPYSVFGPGKGFRVPASPASITWEDLALNMGSPSGPPAPADRIVKNLTVTKSATVTENLTVGGQINGLGSGITGLALAGGVGGTSSTGSLSLVADSDNTNAGELLDFIFGSGGSQFLASRYSRLAGRSYVPFTAPLYDAGGQVYNVKSAAYGAAGDDSTDDTAAIQAAIDDAIAAGGGVVLLPPGRYRYTALSIEGDEVWLRGSGRGVTTLVKTTATGDGITVGASVMRREVKISELGLSSSVAQTAGAAVLAPNFIFLTLDSLTFSGAWDAIVLGNSAARSYNPIVSNIQPAQGIANGSQNRFLYLLRVLDGQYTNVSAIHLPNAGQGVHIDGDCEGNSFVNCHIATGSPAVTYTSGYGLLINNTFPGTLTNPSYNHFTGCLFDAFWIPAYILDGSNNVFNGTWFSSHGPTCVKHGITGGGTLSATGTIFSGCRMYNGSNNGLQVYGPGKLTVTGSAIMANNRAGNASTSPNSAGVLLDMDDDGVVIINGCVIGNDPMRFPSNLQHWGVWITDLPGGSKGYNIQGSTLYPLTTGAIKDLYGKGRGRTIRGNNGCATENGGTDTIASGSTSVTITHGLDLNLAWAATDFQIFPTNNPTNDPGNWWISNVTSTQFTVSVRSNPGAGGFTFAWQARRL